MNFRMTELSGAVLLAQVRKLDMIRSHRANKKIVKAAIEGLPGLGFRAIVDPEGDLATHLVVTFPSAEVAQAVAAELGSIPLAASGWHVYSNMEHLLEKRTVSGKGCPFDCSCFGTARPTTGRACCRRPTRCSPFDEHRHRRLRRQPAPFGLRMRDDEAAARSTADRFRAAAGKHLAG